MMNDAVDKANMPKIIKPIQPNPSNSLDDRLDLPPEKSSLSVFDCPPPISDDTPMEPQDQVPGFDIPQQGEIATLVTTPLVEIIDEVEINRDMMTEDNYSPESSSSKKEDTYELNSASEFNSMLESAMPYYSNLSAEQLEIYDEHLSEIKYDENGEVDIHDPGTIKAFLALKKLVKYEGNIPVKDIPRLNENCKMLGEYSPALSDFTACVNADPELFEGMENFQNSIYSDSGRFEMLTDEEIQQAQGYARQMLDEECAKWGIDDLFKHISLTENTDFTNRFFVNSVDNAWNDWCTEVLVDKNGLAGTKQTNMEVVLLHELYHAKQVRPGASRQTVENKSRGSEFYFMELGATIDLIVRNDELHKRVNDIPLEEEVFYEDTFSFNGQDINFGKVANTFRGIMEQYGCETYEEALLTPEGREFVMQHFSQ